MVQRQVIERRCKTIAIALVGEKEAFRLLEAPIRASHRIHALGEILVAMVLHPVESALQCLVFLCELLNLTIDFLVTGREIFALDPFGVERDITGAAPGNRFHAVLELFVGIPASKAVTASTHGTLQLDRLTRFGIGGRVGLGIAARGTQPLILDGVRRLLPLGVVGFVALARDLRHLLGVLLVGEPPNKFVALSLGLGELRCYAVLRFTRITGRVLLTILSSIQHIFNAVLNLEFLRYLARVVTNALDGHCGSASLDVVLVGDTIVSFRLEFFPVEHYRGDGLDGLACLTVSLIDTRNSGSGNADRNRRLLLGRFLLGWLLLRRRTLAGRLLCMGDGRRHPGHYERNGQHHRQNREPLFLRSWQHAPLHTAP